MIRRHYFLCVLGMFALTTAWVVAQDGGDVDEQRRQLEALRKHPEQLTRLREHLQSFNALPRQRKDAIIKLDHELHQVSTKKRERLWSVMARYAAWLDQLKKVDPQAFQEIKEAPDVTARLLRIKERRDEEWVLTQPESIREQWKSLKGEKRSQLVAKLRDEECQKQRHWQIAKRFWDDLENKKPMPCRLSDFAYKGKKGADEVNKVKEYVTEYLLPYLTDAEKNRLNEAEGHWPEFPQALVEIARGRPSALPPPKLPSHLADLPKPIRAQITLDKKGSKKKLLQELQTFEGRDVFATKVVEIGTKSGSAPFEHEFWPSSQKGLQPAMKDFVERELTPKLQKKERDRLLDSELRWPDYPNTIQDLAKKYNMQPPWHYLPEDKIWKWENYRVPKCRPWSPEIAKAKAG
jgi:hypothetical protein